MACASDSKKFGVLGSKPHDEVWHVRYGGKGIMIYWHVEKYEPASTPVENLFLVRSRGHDGFGVRDTLEHHGLACTPQALRRETPEILAAHAVSGAGGSICAERLKILPSGTKKSQ